MKDLTIMDKLKLLRIYEKLISIFEKVTNKILTVFDHWKILRNISKLETIIKEGEGKMKQGWKTTEFWVTSCTAIIGFLVVFGLITPDIQDIVTANLEKIAGGIIAIISVVSYIWSRTKVKELEIETKIKVNK